MPARITPIWTLLYLLVLTAVSASGQSKPITNLPEPLRTHVKDERFQVVSAIRGLPLGVRDMLQEMWGGALDITDGGEYQGATRRLIAAGCALDQHCLVYYERGGDSPTWVVVLLRWTPEATRLEFGGRAPAGLKTIDDVRRAVLAGAITRNAGW